MEQAEFATRSSIFRGSRGIHRVLDSLGRFFLGIGGEAAPRRRAASERWWDQEEDEGDAVDAPDAADALPMVLGEQARLFDDEGQVAVSLSGPRVAEPEHPVRRVAPRTVPNTVVSAQSRVNGKVVGITVTRAATLDTAVPKAKAVSVAAAPAASVAASRAIARHLVMSRSIYSGPEVARRFSVPLRALRPHFQLFEGAEAVVEDDRGGIRLNQRELRTQRGQVWFV